ncbi:MAG: zf-HC2 domain-containing protein [Bryobacteraceae bacterium]
MEIIMAYCTATQKLSEYLDGGLSDRERCEMVRHLSQCRECAAAAADLRQLRSALRGLVRRVPPPPLESRLHAIASQAASRTAARAALPRPIARWRNRVSLSLDNIMRPLALPLAGGLMAALMLFGMLAPIAVPSRHSGADVPTVLSTQASVKGMAPIGMSDGDMVVDLTVDDQGRMVDYSIVEGQNHIRTEALRRSLENSLLFTEFNPATYFGRPMSGRIRLSFRSNRIDVRG